MPRRAPPVLDPIADYGPALTRLPDGSFEATAAGTVVLEDRPDPDHTGRTRLVRGARRDATIDRLYRTGSLTKPLYDAAQRLLDDCSLASGTRTTTDLLSAGGGGAPGGPTEAQVRALTRVRDVFEAIPINRDSALWWCLFWQPIASMAAYDAHHRVRSGTGSKRLKDDLGKLDTWYNPPRKATEATGRVRVLHVDGGEATEASAGL